MAGQLASRGAVPARARPFRARAAAVDRARGERGPRGRCPWHQPAGREQPGPEHGATTRFPLAGAPRPRLLADSARRSGGRLGAERRGCRSDARCGHQCPACRCGCPADDRGKPHRRRAPVARVDRPLARQPPGDSDQRPGNQQCRDRSAGARGPGRSRVRGRAERAGGAVQPDRRVGPPGRGDGAGPSLDPEAAAGRGSRARRHSPGAARADVRYSRGARTRASRPRAGGPRSGALDDECGTRRRRGGGCSGRPQQPGGRRRHPRRAARRDSGPRPRPFPPAARGVAARAAAERAGAGSLRPESRGSGGPPERQLTDSPAATTVQLASPLSYAKTTAAARSRSCSLANRWFT